MLSQSIPVGSQRVVLNDNKRLGTAIDVVCMKGENELVLVELKCGFAGNRASPVVPKAFMKAPLHKAVDCALHRHFALCDLHTHTMILTVTHGAPLGPRVSPSVTSRARVCQRVVLPLGPHSQSPHPCSPTKPSPPSRVRCDRCVTLAKTFAHVTRRHFLWPARYIRLPRVSLQLQPQPHFRSPSLSAAWSTGSR